MLCCIRVATFVVALMLLLARCAQAVDPPGKGVRPEENPITGAPSAVLIAKDLGGARWSIRFGLEGNSAGRASGIVTEPACPTCEPAFLQCETDEILGPVDNVDAQTWVLTCFVGSKCAGRGNCSPWEFVGERRIPGSFFVPAP